MVGESLFVKAVITSIPKENFRNTVNLLKNCGITPVDVTYGIMGDYYEARNIVLIKVFLLLLILVTQRQKFLFLIKEL